MMNVAAATVAATAAPGASLPVASFELQAKLASHTRHSRPCSFLQKFAATGAKGSIGSNQCCVNIVGDHGDRG